MGGDEGEGVRRYPLAGSLKLSLFDRASGMRPRRMCRAATRRTAEGRCRRPRGCGPSRECPANILGQSGGGDSEDLQTSHTSVGLWNTPTLLI